MKKQPVVGFIRGLVYAVVFVIVQYSAEKLHLTIVTPEMYATIATAAAALIDHIIPTP